jgi:hypothetical protein
MATDGVMDLVPKLHQNIVDYQAIAAKAFAVAAKEWCKDALPDAANVQAESFLTDRYPGSYSCVLVISDKTIKGLVNELTAIGATVRITQVSGVGFPNSTHRYHDALSAYMEMRRGAQ